MKPLRVLYLTFGDAPGGAEVMLAQLLESMDKRIVESHVVVGCNGAVADLLRPYAARLIVEPRLGHIVLHERDPRDMLSNFAAFWRVVASLARRIRHSRYDLLHAAATPAFKYGGIAARIAGVPSLATLNEVLDDRLISPWSRRLLSMNLNAVYRQILVPSEAVRWSAIRAGVEANRLTVFENAIDMDRFSPNQSIRQAVRSELDVESRSFLVGTAGRLIPLKGQEVALRAFASLVAKRPDLRMVVIGGSRNDDERAWETHLRSVASELGVADRVRFAGWRSDVNRVFQALDCLVHTPVLPDASPVVLIEAMAVGLPCIASDIGGIAEIITDGETGLLVPPKDSTMLRDALESIIAEANLRMELGQRARQAVISRFDRQVRARELESVYRELCSVTQTTGTLSRC
jgi:glycosyltransferase involved in cell wall biosynthesis